MSETAQEAWERSTLKQLLLAGIIEQRRKRRWSIFFKLLIIGYIFLLTWYWLFAGSRSEAKIAGLAKHTSVVEVQGRISEDSDSKADNVIASLRRAVKNKNSEGIIVRINTPGGNPVQARLIAKEIKRLRAKYPDIPIYSAIEDVGTSAGYMIAVATQKIYADSASLVGSIGVLFDSFGFVESLNLVGVERRLMTAGENKGMLDPFSPQKPEDKKFMQDMLDALHVQFIEDVKIGRGDKLTEDSQLYSGKFWTGEMALKLGLIDALGDINEIAEQEFNAPKIVSYSAKGNFLGKFMKRFDSSMRHIFDSLREFKILC